MTRVHIAQVNIGRVRAPLEDESMQRFVARLDEINTLAERRHSVSSSTQLVERRPLRPSKALTSSAPWSLDIFRPCFPNLWHPPRRLARGRAKAR